MKVLREYAVMGGGIMDDPTLASCRQGDRTAFATLFSVYGARVYSTALYFCGNEALAKDITQVVFLKVFSKIGQFRDDAEFTTWLYRIVWNACADQKRQARRLVAFEDIPELKNMPARESPERTCVEREVSQHVRRAIARLRPKIRMPMLLKYIEDMSYEEIAVVLKCRKGTVASRLNRGHKLLAKRLAHLRDAAALGDA